MECFLHIGTEKTATTTVQEFLHLNSEKLMQQGVFFSRSVGIRNHTKLAVAAYDVTRRDEFTLGVSSESEFICVQNKITTTLDREISEVMKINPNIKVVFSSEHIQARLTTLNEVQRLKRILTELGFSKITIIVYLRSQPELAQSLFSTALKCGNIIEEPPSPNDKYFNNACNHKETIERFGEVFGDNNMNIRLFDKKEFVNGSILDDFSAAINIKNHNNFMFPTNKNESLSGIAVKLIYSINKVNGDGIPDLELIEYISINSSGNKFLMDSKLYDLYEDTFRLGNEWVRKHYFPNKSTLFPLAKVKQSSANSFCKEDIDQVSNLLCSLWSDNKDNKKALRRYEKSFLFKIYKVAGYFEIKKIINRLRSKV